jgi:hypothetical protein
LGQKPFSQRHDVSSPSDPVGYNKMECLSRKCVREGLYQQAGVDCVLGQDEADDRDAMPSNCGLQSMIAICETRPCGHI